MKTKMRPGGTSTSDAPEKEKIDSRISRKTFHTNRRKHCQVWPSIQLCYVTTKSIQSPTVRQTQFSDNVKTPREILRKQERSGYTAISPKPGYSGGSSSAHVKIVPESK